MSQIRFVILGAGKGTRMHSELPKVLHRVDGKPMARRVVDAIGELGVPSQDIIFVVGYKREMIQAEMGNELNYAVQTEQLGTGHAVLMARDHLRDFEGKVVILYGDMPLVNPDTVQKLIDRCTGNVKGALLTIALDNPPDFGRIVRGRDGSVQRIVEVRDATPEMLAIKEVNVGMYCFDNAALQVALDGLSTDNAQGEYYLTDVPELIAQAGGKVETVAISADKLEEALGINDPTHLQFAESLKEITYAEAQYEVVDKILSDAEFARMLDKILSNPGFAELISRILHDDDLSRELGQLVDRVLADEDFRTNLAALVGTT
ncbi:MAG: NTP transferase domain-containing protein [Desulfobacteraceae bacterium]|nr:NTP transferase domain-containing protein [Desulfobacteraceae bacterium]